MVMALHGAVQIHPSPPYLSREETPCGDAEHLTDDCDFVGFANIGLPQSALLGNNRNTHAAHLTQQTKQFLANHNCLGICFVEAGNVQNGYEAEARDVFEAAVRDGFDTAGATEHGDPQFLWPSESEEVVGVFRAEVPVEQHPLRRNLSRHHTYRAAQIFDISYGPDVGNVRIIASHQPSSSKHKLTYNTRLEVLKSLIHIGVEDFDVRGFVIGGDLNCKPSVIWLAFNEDKIWRETQISFPQIVFANKKAAQDMRARKHGDLAIGLNLKMVQIDCHVQNRDPSHDCVVAGWVRPGKRTENPHKRARRSLAPSPGPRRLLRHPPFPSVAKGFVPEASAPTSVLPMEEIAASPCVEMKKQTLSDEVKNEILSDEEASSPCVEMKKETYSDEEPSGIEHDDVGAAEHDDAGEQEEHCGEQEEHSGEQQEHDDTGEQEEHCSEQEEEAPSEHTEVTWPSEKTPSERSNTGQSVAESEGTGPTQQCMWEDAKILSLMADACRPRSVNCFDVLGSTPPYHVRATAQQREMLRRFVEAALLRLPDERAAPHNTGSEVTLTPRYVSEARRLEHPSEMFGKMEKIMTIRRRYQSDDRAILTETDVSKCWNTMMNEWLATNLRSDQEELKTARKTSIFGAYLNRTYGSKQFVIAIWESGLSWCPEKAHERWNVGAPQQDAAQAILFSFCAWLEKVMAALCRRQNNPSTAHAQERSGMWGPKTERYRRSGLRDEDQALRQERDKLRSHIMIAKALRRECADSKAYDYSGRYTTAVVHHATDNMQWWHYRWSPRRWQKLLCWEKRLLDRLQTGELEEQERKARDLYRGPHTAECFRVTEDS